MMQVHQLALVTPLLRRCATCGPIRSLTKELRRFGKNLGRFFRNIFLTCFEGQLLQPQLAHAIAYQFGAIFLHVPLNMKECYYDTKIPSSPCCRTAYRAFTFHYIRYACQGYVSPPGATYCKSSRVARKRDCRMASATPFNRRRIKRPRQLWAGPRLVSSKIE